MPPLAATPTASAPPRLVLAGRALRLADDADNLTALADELRAARLGLGPQDVVLFPEAVQTGDSRARYEARVRDLARELGCHVVGGSHSAGPGGAGANAGIAVGPDGAILGRYEKLHPYADERARVAPGRALCELELSGFRALVLVCADFFHGDLVRRAARAPDLILVAALSVTRKPTPDYARAIWRHVAVARAYELGAYVGISDWGHPSELPRSRSAGVGGFADPTAVDPERLFRPTGDAPLAVHALDRSALAALHRERRERGFLALATWRGEARGAPGAGAPRRPEA
jgi:predicted amidohydrolase